MLEPLRFDLLQQCRGLSIGQVPEVSENPPLEHRRVGRGRQQFWIVVALQHERIAQAERVDDMRRDRTAIGENSEPMTAIIEYELNRLPRVVRHRE